MSGLVAINSFSPGFTLKRFLTPPPPFHHPNVRCSSFAAFVIFVFLVGKHRPLTEKTAHYCAELELGTMVENAIDKIVVLMDPGYSLKLVCSWVVVLQLDV